jgi:hypothetical protein
VAPLLSYSVKRPVGSTFVQAQIIVYFLSVLFSKVLRKQGGDQPRSTHNFINYYYFQFKYIFDAQTKRVRCVRPVGKQYVKYISDRIRGATISLRLLSCDANYEAPRPLDKMIKFAATSLHVSKACLKTGKTTLRMVSSETR